ncbi:PIR Superfamily Protein, partial [Plasmodium ovale curtisi]
VQNYDLFYGERTKFIDIDNIAHTDILKVNDPVLRNNALYLIQYYNDVNPRCSMVDDCSLFCELMNKWLNEKEAIYTSNGKCALNYKLWNTYIEKLWNVLGTNSDKGNWCKRERPKYVNNNYPQDWIPESCNNPDSIDISISCNYDPYNKTLELPTPDYSTSPRISFSQSYGYVLFVLLLTSILLYKFSPLGTWLDNKIGNKNRIRENINSEAMEEFPRSSAYTSSPSSSKFNVIYHSLEN